MNVEGELAVKKCSTHWRGGTERREGVLEKLNFITKVYESINKNKRKNSPIGQKLGRL